MGVYSFEKIPQRTTDFPKYPLGSMPVSTSTSAAPAGPGPVLFLAELAEF